MTRRSIVPAAPERLRQALHGGELFLPIVGVLVTLPIMQLPHEIRHPIANLQGHGLCQHGCRVLFCRFIRHIKGVGLGRQRKICDRMGQMDAAFRHTDKMARLIRRHRNFQSAAIRHANILAGETHEPSGHIERILPGLQHPRQPVYSRVHIAVAHGFMQGRN